MFFNVKLHLHYLIHSKDSANLEKSLWAGDKAEHEYYDLHIEEEQEDPAFYQCSYQRPEPVMVWGCIGACGNVS